MEVIAGLAEWPLIGVGRTAKVYACSADEVLKVFEDWFPESAIQTELEIGLKLNGLAAGAPACLGREQLGRQSAIRYQRIAGRPLGSFLADKPLRLGWVGSLMARAHLQLGQNSGAGLMPIKERLAWAINAQEKLAGETRHRVLALLATLPDGEALCHGDFHPLNLMVDGQDVRVIDWMNASRGPVEADVARSLIILWFARDVSRPAGFLESLVIDMVLRRLAKEYLNRWLRAAGGRPAFRRAAVQAWLLPQAVARLSEDPAPRERQRLLSLIRRELRQSRRAGI